MTKKKYHIIGLGGTFDHLHIGHQRFLQFAAGLADKLEIGVTTATYLQQNVKNFPDSIEPYDARVNQLQEYLITIGVKFHIFPLEDKIGNTLQGSNVEVLAVTTNTLNGAEAINASRKVLGLKSLPIHICDILEDKSKLTISAERIRNGQINRQGESYSSTLIRDIVISNTQRELMREKQGKLITAPGDKKGAPIILVVGDVVLETFIENGWPYNIGVFDRRSERREYSSDVLDDLVVTTSAANDPGTMSRELSLVLEDMVEGILKTPKANEQAASKRHLLVTGEEDLAAVTAVFLLPLGSLIYYGQKGEGMVMIEVTEEIKEKFRRLFE